MRKESGVTLITVVIMIIIISIIATASIVASRKIFDESKENVVEKNRFLVESAVSKYSAKAATGGVFSPANEEFPGIQNPTFDYVSGVDASGDNIIEKKGVGKDWYLLLEDSLKEMGITYAEESYLVNYKENIVIPLIDEDDVFELIEYHLENN